MTTRKEYAKKFDKEGYDIVVKGRHVAVTAAMKDYAMEKVSKIERFTNRIIDVVITMDIQKLLHRCDVILKADYTTIRAHADTTDMYASIDLAVHKIEEQLKRFKRKLQEHHARPLKVIDMQVNVFKRPDEVELEEINEEIEEENVRELAWRPPLIVESETYPLKVLTNDEAIMKMELSGEPFMIFKREEDRKLKVIYRRQDGNYGIVDVET